MEQEAGSFTGMEELRVKHGLKLIPFREKAMDTFGLIDGEILGGWGRVLSMDRNRSLAWHGTVNTKDAIKQVIRKMAELKMVLFCLFNLGERVSVCAFE